LQSKPKEAIMTRALWIATIAAGLSILALATDAAQAQSKFASAWEVFGQVKPGQKPTFGKPFQIQPGSAPYKIEAVDENGNQRNRWGDYSATTVDPTDKTFWAVQEFAKSPRDTWSTEIVHTDVKGKVLNKFEGISLTENPPIVPPDTMGAIGPQNFMETLNNKYAVYDKAGKQVKLWAQPMTFWNDALRNAGLGQQIADLVFDPRVLYDPVGQHWYASALTKSVGGNLTPNNDILIAVSKDTNPAGTWYGYAFGSSRGLAADFDTLGMNKDHVYVSVNNYTFLGGVQAYQNNSLIDLTKNTMGMVGIAPTNMFKDVNAAQIGSSVEPVVDYNSTLTTALKGAAFLAADPNNQGRNLFRQVLDKDGNLQANPTSIATQMNYDEALGAPQPYIPDLIDTGDRRLSSSVIFANDFLWAVQTVKDKKTGLSDIRWFQISPDVKNPTVVNEGVISDPQFAYYYGSIAVNADGQILIGFSGSAVPEPDGLVLLAAGAVSILLWRGVATRFGQVRKKGQRNPMTIALTFCRDKKQ
jgi:hypothetical protein